MTTITTSSRISRQIPHTNKPSKLTQRSFARKVASYNLCHRPSYAQSDKTQTSKYRASVFASSRPIICQSRGLKEAKNRNRTHGQPLSNPISSSSALSHPRGSQTKSHSSQVLYHNTLIRLRRCFLRRRTSGRCLKM